MIRWNFAGGLVSTTRALFSLFHLNSSKRFFLAACFCARTIMFRRFISTGRATSARPVRDPPTTCGDTSTRCSSQGSEISVDGGKHDKATSFAQVHCLKSVSWTKLGLPILVRISRPARYRPWLNTTTHDSSSFFRLQTSFANKSPSR